MVSALVSGSSGPGSSPGRGHCVVFLGKILLVASCYRNRDKLRPDGPPGSYADFTFTFTFTNFCVEVGNLGG